MKLDYFQPELVIETFPEPTLRNNPPQINRGYCMRWAYCAHQMFEDVELWSMIAHAFIKYNDKFYDAERLQGEEDWRNLPACNFGIINGIEQSGESHSLLQFKNLNSYPIIRHDWNWYDHLIREFLIIYRD